MTEVKSDYNEVHWTKEDVDKLVVEIKSLRNLTTIHTLLIMTMLRIVAETHCKTSDQILDLLRDKLVEGGHTEVVKAMDEFIRSPQILKF